MLDVSQREAASSTTGTARRVVPPPAGVSELSSPAPVSTVVDGLGAVLARNVFARTVRGRATGALIQRDRYKPGDKVKLGGDEYTVEQLLRPGASEEPYLVKDASERPWVIKSFGQDRKPIYEQEKSFMSAVQGSDNVVKLQTFDDAQLLLLMEYVAFGSVAETLGKHKELVTSWSDEQRRSLVRDILVGLAHVHAKGVIHNEIDAKNIFLGGTDEVPVAKIADFGDNSFAKDMSDEDQDWERLKDFWGALTPIVRIVSNDKITRAQTLHDNPSVIANAGCSQQATAFLNTVRAFVTAWQTKRRNGDSPDRAGLVQLTAPIRQHHWLA